MKLQTRKLLDKSFTGLNLFSAFLLISALIIVLGPIFFKGIGAFVFKGTVEYRRMIFDQFGRGNKEKIFKEIAYSQKARKFIYDNISDFEKGIIVKPYIKETKKIYKEYKEYLSSLELPNPHKNELRRKSRSLYSLFIKAVESIDKEKVENILNQILSDPYRKRFDSTPMTKMFHLVTRYSEIVNQVDLSNREVYLENLIDLKDQLRTLLGPFPKDPKPILPRNQYGQTRWDRSLVKLNDVLFIEKYDYSDSSEMGQIVQYPRSEIFKGTTVEHIFSYLEDKSESILLPKTVFYWRFFTDVPLDSNIFGGIKPAILGTFYLTFGALLFSIPLGIIAAIYLTEFAKENWLIQLIRTCIGTLAGVPSIVFGLFGSAFFINTIHVSSSKSVLAGSMTLAILVLPTVIRASEEAIRAVPHTYKEASLSLGASRWRAVLTVILPAALPGILTGIIISMGRAAGETAPIIFTAAVSVGQPLKLWETLSQATPALSWNIYNLCTEHEAVDEIRHVQYGMVLTLVLLVLLINIIAIILRARINKRLIGRT